MMTSLQREALVKQQARERLMKDVGIAIKPGIGIGDALQMSSLPENYFRCTGRKLIDVSAHWMFNHNPYVDRLTLPERTVQLWNWPKQWEWPRPRDSVYTCNAELWASLFSVPVVLNRPRLYQFEEYPYEERYTILFHTHGRSHGTLPPHVIDHVIQKYKDSDLFHIGLPTDPDLGIRKLETPSLWDLVESISKCRMLIGIDSGPTWIGACFPDVITKKIRNIPVHGEKPFTEWVPLEIDNIHSHWDDRGLFQIFYPGEDDMGFMSTYRKI